MEFQVILYRSLVILDDKVRYETTDCFFILTSSLEVHNQIPIGSMVAWYIYLHENHKKIIHLCR